MPTDWKALAKLAFKKDTAVAAPVRRKVAEKPVTLTRIPVMFPGDDLCPDWPELVAWAKAAPAVAFEILPCRAPHKDARGLRLAGRESLRLHVLDALAESGGAVVVGLIYELRTLKQRWEAKQCAS